MQRDLIERIEAQPAPSPVRPRRPDRESSEHDGAGSRPGDAERARLRRQPVCRGKPVGAGRRPGQVPEVRRLVRWNDDGAKRFAGHIPASECILPVKYIVASRARPPAAATNLNQA